MFNERLVFCVCIDFVEGYVVEIDKIIKLHELFKIIVVLVLVFLFEIRESVLDWRVNLISDIVKSRHAVLDFISRT